jgi:signal transduction histidine kinase
MWVKTDPKRLTQILIKLLGDTIKFTAKGQMQLAVTYCRAHCSRNGTLHIQVSATGPGIPWNELELIYAPFYQIPNAQNTTYGHALQGNDLGLSVSVRPSHLASLSQI